MPHSNEFIAGGSDADRFLMGLLRAHADAVLIGSGVLRASPKSTWRPRRSSRRPRTRYAELRRKLGTTPEPEIAVLTGSGAIDVAHPVFGSRAVVLTSDAGADRLEAFFPRRRRSCHWAPPRRSRRPRSSGAARARPSPHPLRGRPAHLRRPPRGRCRRRAFLTSSPLLVGDAGPVRGSRSSRAPTSRPRRPAAGC